MLPLRPPSAQDRACAGGIIPDVHLRYALGPADPFCLLKDVMPVGSTLNTGYYAIAMSPYAANVTTSFLIAASTLVTLVNNYQVRKKPLLLSAQAKLVLPASNVERAP